ncbi:hypothetical protein [Gloeobacter morelensis]|uniref:Uncharacterized protein n=1 Tax=Gloeobacter morelensis MG652769 TaxID=2781736 RepID=A0ABY3PP55_9CYAN|nr:hypothetical protein [Gloeobacter morelensis]UFP95480.1 hypothetical protein ISF26_04315 [Gloeobacter morelensis MG652769]
MDKLLFCLLLLGTFAPQVWAQTSPPIELNVTTTNARHGEAVRQSVIENWQLPRLMGDATVRVRATVLLSGAVVEPELVSELPPGPELEEVRRSLNEAIGRTVAAVPPGPIEFTITARSGGAYLEGCFPLKVYVDPRLQDSPEPVPSVLLEAIAKGTERWNRLMAGFTRHAASEPFVMVGDPEAADVRVETYEQYPDFSSYLVSDDSRLAVVRLPLKQRREGLFAAGYRWRHPEVITQQAMFQLGRLLGLDPTAVPNNVLFPGASYALDARSINGSTELLHSVVVLGNGPDLSEEGRTARTIVPQQLRSAEVMMRMHSCGQTAGLPTR